MKIEQKLEKHFVLFALFTLFACIGAVTVTADVQLENGVLTVEYDEGAYDESSFIGAFVGMIVGGLVAVNVLPIFANQTATLEENDDLDSNEQGLVGTWTMFVIIAVIGFIVGGIGF